MTALLGDYRGGPWDRRAEVWVILAKKPQDEGEDHREHECGPLDRSVCMRYRRCEAREDVKLGKFINLYGCAIGDETKIGAFVEIQKNANGKAVQNLEPHVHL